MYDLVIKNGILADGMRTKPQKADICIENGIISQVCERFEGEAEQVIDAKGQIVAPGFIDIHTHSDASPLIEDYEPQAKLFQGVTLEITGNCGISTVPNNSAHREEVNQYYQKTLGLPMGSLVLREDSILDVAKRIKKTPPSSHYGMLIGHGTLRGSVMGFDLRDPEPAELEKMEQVLHHELQSGAFGLSLGLIYPPSSFAGVAELVALAKVVKQHEGIMSVHMRSEGPRIFEAVDEMLEIARQSGVHLQLSHLKLMGKPQWGRAEELLSRLEDARAEGLKITCDQYPYTATSTSLTALCPKWAFDGGMQKLLERVNEPDPRLLNDIRAEMENRGGAEAVVIVSTMNRMPEACGKNIAELSSLLHCSPEETVTRCLVKCQGAVNCNYFCLNQTDMLHIMKNMEIAVGSDGVNYPYDPHIMEESIHPRSYGTFPRFLQTVREHNLMPIEDAVYKMTGLPAAILGITDRGTIAPGKVADLTVFNQEAVKDCCTFFNPLQKPEGINHVIVGGVPAIQNGVRTKSRTGELLFHT
ncbi:MAG: D-aminoacylase [Clostridium sp.]|uniref:N-acyl-D-amino-acid deacylase family protein n=1 Tax=Clostridium sp. TaxID=1506 RepID=UPI002907D41D|nr:D-aminoacylase [Clostridium sp.]MDU7338837.1 D-aminoacylase [Clostridium sp.]